MNFLECGIAAVAAGFSGCAAFSAMQAARSSNLNAQAANRTAELAAAGFVDGNGPAGRTGAWA
ncbi:hypothetical protein [Streptomyces tsukubensis]|uniref:hypothetical protein n=1 Tax=Streptomyces tsukubensis TaxID=83656 RepID=UPI00344EA1B7